MTSSSAAADRRTYILETALGTFSRFGYRKASMDELARAAGLSRQGLYLHYPNKEALFRAAVDFLFERGLSGAQHALKSQGKLEERIVLAFDAWHGEPAELLAASPFLPELIETSRALIGGLEQDAVARFIDMLTVALNKAGAKSMLAKLGCKPRQVAEMLNATSTGLKHSGKSRAEYQQGMRIAVRLVIAQLASNDNKGAL